MPALSAASSAAPLLNQVVDSLGPGTTYKQAKQILEQAINQLPSGPRQKLLDGLPHLRQQLKTLLKETEVRASRKKSPSWATQSQYLSAVHETSDTGRLLQARLPAGRQLLQVITSNNDEVESIRACSRLSAASAAPDVCNIVLHACQLADRVLQPVAASLLSAAGTCIQIKAQSSAAPCERISAILSAVGEVGAIARLRAGAGNKESVQLLRNCERSESYEVWGGLLFTLAAAQVCKSLVLGKNTEWNNDTLHEVHAQAVAAISCHAVSLDTDDAERFLLGHPVLRADSLGTAPWAAVPMCAWLAVRTVVRGSCTTKSAQSLQAVLLQRMEQQVLSIVGNVSECSREMALVRDTPCTREAVEWIRSLPPGGSTPVPLCGQLVEELTLASLLLDRLSWDEIQALNTQHLAAMNGSSLRDDQRADDQSLFVLDNTADPGVEEWEGSEDLSDQVLSFHQP